MFINNVNAYYDRRKSFAETINKQVINVWNFKNNNKNK